MPYVEERTNKTKSFDGNFHNAHGSMFGRKPGSIWRDHNSQIRVQDTPENRTYHVQGPSSDEGSRRWTQVECHNPHRRTPNYRSVSTPRGGYTSSVWSDDAPRSYHAVGSSNASVTRKHDWIVSSTASSHNTRNRYGKPHSYTYTQPHERNEGKFVGEDPFASDDEGYPPTSTHERRRYVSPNKKPAISASSDGCFTSRDFATWASNDEAGESQSTHLSNSHHSTPRRTKRTNRKAQEETTSISAQIKLGFQKVKAFVSNAFQKLKERITPICAGRRWRPRSSSGTDSKAPISNEALLKCDTYSHSFEFGR
ncbi:hypothetical protein, conserved [Babesia bigemina]|uniref:Uncharacterized protein n=1 Tax=Babesia bigemina TaxID=5866 RepID=A0A061D8A7_BABBI|nr:hypothetical protein, conserved [Babesia bigemina]CDR93965.1 hypothetical protein, conserved [Babesia bigemina]|eukprot:XP_012766151.1 hypothetical protein, conserved [Babesia bigemina]